MQNQLYFHILQKKEDDEEEKLSSVIHPHQFG